MTVPQSARLLLRLITLFMLVVIVSCGSDGSGSGSGSDEWPPASDLGTGQGVLRVINAARTQEVDVYVGADMQRVGTVQAGTVSQDIPLDAGVLTVYLYPAGAHVQSRTGDNGVVSPGDAPLDQLQVSIATNKRSDVVVISRPAPGGSSGKTSIHGLGLFENFGAAASGKARMRVVHALWEEAKLTFSFDPAVEPPSVDLEPTTASPQPGFDVSTDPGLRLHLEGDLKSPLSFALPNLQADDTVTLIAMGTAANDPAEVAVMLVGRNGLIGVVHADAIVHVLDLVDVSPNIELMTQGGTNGVGLYDSVIAPDAKSVSPKLSYGQLSDGIPLGTDEKVYLLIRQDQSGQRWVEDVALDMHPGGEYLVACSSPIHHRMAGQKINYDRAYECALAPATFGVGPDAIYRFVDGSSGDRITNMEWGLGEGTGFTAFASTTDGVSLPAGSQVLTAQGVASFDVSVSADQRLFAVLAGTQLQDSYPSNAVGPPQPAPTDQPIALVLVTPTDSLSEPWSMTTVSPK